MAWIDSIPGLVTAGLAVYAVNAWRRDYLGRRRIDLAEEVLRLFHYGRDIIATVRSPIGVEGEGTTRKAKPGETPEEKELRDERHVFSERIRPHRDTFARLAAIKYECIARFGATFREPFERWGEILTEISVSNDILYAKLEQISATPEPRKEMRERQDEIRDLRRRVRSISDDDPIRKRLDTLVADVEGRCRPIIDPPHPWRDWGINVLRAIERHYPKLKFWEW